MFVEDFLTVAGRCSSSIRGATWGNGCNHLVGDVDELDLLLQQGSYVHSSVIYRTLKKCIAEKNLALGKRVHALTVSCGHASNVFLSNHIICMYGSLGRLDEAVQVFAQVPTPDRFMWASIILVHVRNEQPVEAIRLYRRMRGSSIKPDNHVFAAILKACSSARDLSFGREVHADILSSGIDPDLFVGGCLVEMYAKCGSVVDARRVFDTLPAKDTVTWTAMITGYADHGLCQEALSVFDEMQQDGITPADSVVFVCLLKACAKEKSLHHGKQLHLQIARRGLDADLIVGNCLLDMYGKCGCPENARRVFDGMKIKDLVSWNCMLAGYVHNKLGQSALALYARMQEECASSPDSLTFVSLLQACTSMETLQMGQQLHGQIQERGLQKDVVVGSCLVDMYAKCGSLLDARQVFDELSTKDVVTWTTMIAGYANSGLGKEALSLYENMRMEGINVADNVTFACLLKACTSLGDLQHGKQLHSHILERGLEVNLVVGNALVDMYGKCGSLVDAQKVFHSLLKRDVATWNALILGYVGNGQGQEALQVYSDMAVDGKITPNCVTFVGLLKACASVGALFLGKKIHEEIEGRGLEEDLVLGNCLVDMYGKCGSLSEARRVLKRSPSRDVVTWNALLNGYALKGDGQMAVMNFKEMRQEGIMPDGVTFTCLLVACSHEGLLDEGRQYFKIMSEDYGIVPTLQHYTCMLDLLARSGNLDEAEKLWLSLPFQDDIVGWTSLLSACKSHGDVDRGKRCFDQLIRLDPGNGTAYALLASLYGNLNRWTDAHVVESLRRCAGAKKKPASACIEVQNVVREFTLGDDRSDVSSKLKNMSVRLKDEGGHVPLTTLVMKAVSDKEKEGALCGHVEKLAVAYGLLNTSGGTRLLVTKNLRMCDDCHSATKVLSRVERREIVVRDSHRVHSFSNGNCSCGDRP